MKKARTLPNVMIILSLILMICTIDDFLSLHDIKKDYISQTALQYLELEISGQLPEWTNTNLEWTSVTVSFWIRLLMIILNLMILCSFKKHTQKT